MRKAPRSQILIAIGYLILVPLLIINLVLIIRDGNNGLAWVNVLLLPLTIAQMLISYRQSMRDSARKLVDQTIPPDGDDPK